MSILKYLFKIFIWLHGMFLNGICYLQVKNFGDSCISLNEEFISLINILTPLQRIIT